MYKQLALGAILLTALTSTYFLTQMNTLQVPIKNQTIEQWNDCIHAAERKHPFETLCNVYQNDAEKNDCNKVKEDLIDCLGGNFGGACMKWYVYQEEHALEEQVPQLQYQCSKQCEHVAKRHQYVYQNYYVPTVLDCQ